MCLCIRRINGAKTVWLQKSAKSATLFQDIQYLEIDLPEYLCFYNNALFAVHPAAEEKNSSIRHADAEKERFQASISPKQINQPERTKERTCFYPR